MPYNNSAIAPSEEITGVATLPLARVKKILAQDEEINSVSANAAFAITIATEMFIRYMATQAYNVTKSEKKPRRTLTYNDVAKAVASIDNLEFLQDLIPETQSYGAYKAKRAAKAKQAPSLQNGQTTLDGTHAQPNQVLETAEAPEEMQDVEATEQGGPSVSAGEGTAEPAGESAQQYTFEHYEGPNGSAHRDEYVDVEMN